MSAEITPGLIIIWILLGLGFIGHCIFWIKEILKKDDEDHGGII